MALKDANEDKTFTFDFYIFENLIKKYRHKDVKGIVYKLSYAGKFIIVKGKTLAGSLIILAEGFYQYRSDNSNPRFIDHLYTRFYDHIINNKGRFRIKVLGKEGKKTTQYDLLKREQMELDKNQGNPNLLNRYTEAYVPKYNTASGAYGWLVSDAVKKYQGYMISKRRKQYMERYKFKR